MPWLVGESDRERLKRETLGAAKDRMLREMAEAIEAFTADTPLILVLEDLQWSDNSTVDLIAYLARRPGLARLLIVGTFRPAETIVEAPSPAGIAARTAGPPPVRRSTAGAFFGRRRGPLYRTALSGIPLRPGPGAPGTRAHRRQSAVRGQCGGRTHRAPADRLTSRWLGAGGAAGGNEDRYSRQPPAVDRKPVGATRGRRAPALVGGQRGRTGILNQDAFRRHGRHLCRH